MTTVSDLNLCICDRLFDLFGIATSEAKEIATTCSMLWQRTPSTVGMLRVSRKLPYCLECHSLDKRCFVDDKTTHHPKTLRDHSMSVQIAVSENNPESHKAEKFAIDWGPAPVNTYHVPGTRRKWCHPLSAALGKQPARAHVEFSMKSW